MLCLDCTFVVLVEVSSVTRFFFCLYLHCAVMFTVLFGVSSGGQSFRLSSLVGEVWVVYYYLFLCGLLSLSLSCMDQVGIFCYIYSLANYISINYFFVYLLTVLGEWCALVFAYYWRLSSDVHCCVLCSLAGGGSSWCCCSVHLHCSGGTELVSFSAAGCMYYRALCVGLAVLKSRRWY